MNTREILKITRVAILIIIPLLFASNGIMIKAQDYYVSRVNGSDGNDGLTIEKAFKTIKKASEIMTGGDTCYIAGGTYREEVSPQNSGTKENPITYRNYNDEQVIITTTDLITGWTNYSGEIYSADINFPLNDANQVFINGKMVQEARWPNSSNENLLQPTLATADSGTANNITDSALAEVGSGFWTGAKIWILSGVEWISQVRTITSHSGNTLTFNSPIGQGDPNYTPKASNGYYITKTLKALDAPGEWYYGSGKLYLMAPNGDHPDGYTIEAKRRFTAIELSNKVGINIIGINIFGGAIRTNANTRDCVYDGITAKYVSHQFESTNDGFALRGNNITLKNSILDTAFSSTVFVAGSNNSVINCLIQNGGYGGGWNGQLVTSGKNHLISHNTVRNSGRDGMSLSSLNSQVQYNDVYNVGYLQEDMGIIHFGNADGGNTRIHHNFFHDGKTDDFTAGIYLDNMDNNYIIDHNVIWGCDEGIRLNTPSRYSVIYNNTFYGGTRGGFIGSGIRTDYADGYGVRLSNNIFTDQIYPLGSMAICNNIYNGTDPQFVSPTDLTLKPTSPAIDAGIVIEGITGEFTGSAPDCGAFEYGVEPFKVGHDFDNPPNVQYEQPPMVEYMNLVINGSFEDNLNNWNAGGNISTATADPWADENANTFVQKKSARLGSGICGINQTVYGLKPNTMYTLSAFVKVTGNERVRVGVGDNFRESGETLWRQLTLDFVSPSGAGADEVSANIYIEKITEGNSNVYVDLVGVQLKDIKTFNDDFEDDLSGWTVEGDGAITNRMSRNGNSSYKVENGGYITRNLSDFYTKTFSIWMYDDFNDKSVQGTVLIKEGNQIEREIGVNTDYSTNNYMYRVNDKWYTTEVPRQTGWHEIMFDYTTSGQVDMYIDGTVLATFKDAKGASSFQCGDRWNDDNWGNVYFDDFKIQGLDMRDGSFDHSMGGWITAQNPRTSYQWHELKVNGGRSYLIDEDVDYISKVFEQPQKNVVTLWMYDNRSDSSVKAFARVDMESKDEENGDWRGIGIDTSASNNYFVVRTGQETKVTTVPRRTGWHKLQWDYSHEQGVYLYLNDIEVMKIEGNQGYNHISMGDWWSDGTTGTTLFDHVDIRDALPKNQTVFEDSFENDLGAWKAAAGTLSFSQSVKRTGSQSLLINEDKEVIELATSNISYNKKATIWLYDNAADNTFRVFFRADDGSVATDDKIRGIGVDTNTSKTHYVYRIASTTTATTINRTTGWHKLTLDYTNENSVDFYIDDVYITSAPGADSFSYVSVCDYWEDNSTGPYYFDDFKIYSEEDDYNFDYKLYQNYGEITEKGLNNLEPGKLTLKLFCQYNKRSYPWDATLIVALFKDDRLDQVDFHKVTPTDSNAELVGNINFVKVDDGSEYTLKCMILNNSKNLQPLRAVEVYYE